MKTTTAAVALLSILATGCAADIDPLMGPQGSALTWRPSPTHHLRVKVLVIDPAIHRPDGTLARMSVAHPGWQNDFRAFPESVATALETASHGTLTIDFVGMPVVETGHLPVFEDGYRYTNDQLEAIYNADNAHRFTLRHRCTGTADDPHCADQVDYVALSNEYHFADGIARNEYDEVWVFGAPFSGFYESRMLGSHSYWCNAPEERGVSGRNFVVMGYNFERGLESALHSYGHRAESILRHAYGLFGLFYDFWAYEDNHHGRGGIGTIHIPVNGQHEYDYGNTRTVTTSAEAFGSVPMLAAGDHPRTNVSCSAWGCTEEGYMRWWFSHMPYGQPNAPDWWANVAMLQDDVNESLPHACATHWTAYGCSHDSACTWYPCANACALTVGTAPSCANPSPAPSSGTCGDGTCQRGDDAGEDCETCPADCGACSSPSPAPSCPAGTNSIWTCNASRTARVRCIGGVVSTEPCANGCDVRPTGTDDVCAASSAETCGNGTCGAGETCSNCATDCGACAGATCPSGTYSIWTCNATHTARVRCIGGVVSTETCSNGCVAYPTGTDDQCATSGATCPSGTYAIWTCNPARTARTRCIGGVVTTENCPSGCHVNPVGTDDVCNP